MRFSRVGPVGPGMRVFRHRFPSVPDHLARLLEGALDAENGLIQVSIVRGPAATPREGGVF